MKSDTEIRKPLYRICYAIVALIFCGDMAMYFWFFTGSPIGALAATGLLAASFFKAMAFIVFLRGVVELKFPEFALGGICCHVAYKFTQYDLWEVATGKQKLQDKIASIFVPHAHNDLVISIAMLLGGMAMLVAIAYWITRSRSAQCRN